MSERVEFPLSQGGSVVVEVDSFYAAGTRRGRSGDRPQLERAAVEFDEAVRNVRPALEGIIGHLREISGPESIELTFGLKFDVEAGAIIAKTSLEANIAVKLTWKHEEKGKQESPH